MDCVLGCGGDIVIRFCEYVVIGIDVLEFMCKKKIKLEFMLVILFLNFFCNIIEWRCVCGLYFWDVFFMWLFWDEGLEMELRVIYFMMYLMVSLSDVWFVIRVICLCLCFFFKYYKCEIYYNESLFGG